MKKDLKLGIYRHFKGKYYLVLGLARHSETEEKFVVYVSLYVGEGPRMFVRPLDMFLEKTIVRNGKKQPRFVYIGPEMPSDYKEILDKPE